MSDAVLLSTGVLCFSLMLIGLLLTAMEFRHSLARRRSRRQGRRSN